MEIIKWLASWIIQTKSAKDIRFQKTKHLMKREIQSFLDKQKKAQKEIQKFQEMALTFTLQQKKQKAKTALQKKDCIKIQIQTFKKRRQAIQINLGLLQKAQINKCVVEALTDAQTFFEDTQKYAEKLDDIIFNITDQEQQQAIINDKLTCLVQNDQIKNRVDDQYEQLVNRLKKEKQRKIAQKKQNVDIYPKMNQKQQQTQGDEISRMMMTIA